MKIFLRKTPQGSPSLWFVCHRWHASNDSLYCRGSDFEALYNKYEASDKARKTIKAQELWFAIIEAQTETGTPYLLYKDACNSKSNQQVMQ